MATLGHSIIFACMLISVQFDCYPAFIHLLCCSMIYFCGQLLALFMLDLFIYLPYRPVSLSILEVLCLTWPLRLQRFSGHEDSSLQRPSGSECLA